MARSALDENPEAKLFKAYLRNMYPSVKAEPEKTSSTRTVPCCTRTSARSESAGSTLDHFELRSHFPIYQTRRLELDTSPCRLDLDVQLDGEVIFLSILQRSVSVTHESFVTCNTNLFGEIEPIKGPRIEGSCNAVFKCHDNTYHLDSHRRPYQDPSSLSVNQSRPYLYT